MPLSPDEIASFAIRLTTARYLDPECCGCEGEEATKELNAASDLLSGRTGLARLGVLNADEIAPFLTGTAEELAVLNKKYPQPPLANLESAERHLRELAAGACQCGNGDGVASEKQARK